MSKFIEEQQIFQYNGLSAFKEKLNFNIKNLKFKKKSLENDDRIRSCEEN